MRITPVYALVAALALTIAGCGKKEEPPQPQPAPPPVTMPAPPPAQPAAPPPQPAGVAIASITLGNAIGNDLKVPAPAEAFAPGDTIYASIDTTGTGTVVLKAKWTYHRGEQVAVVKEDVMSITNTGPATNEFHVSKPDGWPVGDYQVEILLNDQPAGVRKFAVR